ncbi:hypothetical protein [Corynebacterium anserum]|uniref:hypothetical protein n=1 Tax=Corynebacterium anserum TaxID=2684406 RepID=UPI00163B5772|nr:hypothetical protein [Corynebacterium anserum]
MQLKTVREAWGAENQKWLGSAHATNAAQTVTLDATKLASVADAGVIPSGIPLKKAESGKFEPVTAAGDKLTGFLFTSQPFKADAGDIIAPMLDHGRIRTEFLPAKAFDVTTLTNANPLFGRCPNWAEPPVAVEGGTTQ